MQKLKGQVGLTQELVYCTASGSKIESFFYVAPVIKKCYLLGGTTYIQSMIESQN